MATITDLVHDVTSYLVTQCQANASLGNGGAGNVFVYDGPTTPGEQSSDYSQRLWIGYDAFTASYDAASATQKFAFLGASGNVRDETGDIICTAEAWSGDTVAANSRVLCKGIVGAVETMLRGAPTTGPGDSTMGGLVQWSEVTGLDWKQTQASQSGYSAMCVFHVTYYARLNP